MKRDFSEKRKGSGEKRKGGLLFLISPDLISCNFSTIFAHFQTKKGTFARGQYIC